MMRMQSASAKIAFLFAIILTISISFWLFLLFVNQLAHSVIPGASVQASTSLAPITIELRSDYKLNIHNDSPSKRETLDLRWILTLPRAYVNQEIGTNWNISSTNIGYSNSHFVWISIMLNRINGEIIPLSLSTAKSREKSEVDQIDIDLSNLPDISSDKKEGNFCETTNEHLGYSSPPCNPQCERLNNFPEAQDNCVKNSKCNVYMGLDGWGLKILVPWTRIDKAKEYCALLRPFLIDHSIRRDVAFKH